MAESCSTVLLIDDSIDDRSFVRCCLEQEGEPCYTILAASTGAAGLELCQQHPPDVILLNSSLPDFNGLDLLQQLPEQPPIPVIMLAESGEPETVMHAMQSGAADCLVKTDLSSDRLRYTVRNALKQGCLQRQLAQQAATIAQQLQIQKDLEESQFCLRLINTITGDRTVDLTPDQVVMRIAQQIRHFYAGLRVRYCVIAANAHLQTQISLQPLGQLDCTGMQFDLAQSSAYLAALRANQPVVAADVFQETILIPIASHLAEMNIQAMLAIPLQHSDTELGVLSLTCDQPRTWSSREVQTFSEIADFLAFALDSVRIRQQQQQAEAALHQSEAALKEAQRVAHIGNWEFDIQTQTITWSEELYRMFGLELSQPVPPYAEYLEKIHPDDHLNLMRCVETAITHGTPYVIDYRAILPDGTIRYHEGRGEVVKNAAGDVIKLLGTALDITERQQTEAALRDSEAQNRAILSATPDIMAVLDANGTYLSCSFNRFTGELIRVKNLDVTGMHVTEVLPPEFAAQWLSVIPQVLSTGEMQVHEQQNRFGDRIQYEEVRMVPYQDNQILCLVRNITDRKQAELELRQREAQLAAIAANIPGGVFRFVYHSDGSYSCPFASEGYRTLLGIDPAQLRSHPAQNLAMVHPNDRPIYLTAIADAIARQTQAFQIEVRYILPTGEVKWIATNAQLQHQNNGDVIVDGIDVDITYRKTVEDALRQSEAKQTALIHALPDLIMRVNREGIYLDFFTTSSFKVIGSPETMVGTHVQDTLPPELAQRRLDAIQTALETGELQVYEHEIWVDGRLQTEECRVAVCGDNEVLIIGRDISDRKRAEAKIRQSEEQLRLTLDFTGIGAWIWQPLTGAYQWNGNMQQLLDLPSGLDNMFQVWRDHIHAADVGRVEASIEHALTTHSAFTEEYRYQLSDGRVVWRWVKGQGIYTETGEIEQVLGVVQDITDRKRAEEALRESEMRFRGIFNSAFQFIGLFSLTGHMLSINETALTFAGLSLENVVGQLCWETPWFADLPDAQSQLQKYVAIAASGEFCQFEFQAKGKNGLVLDLDASFKPLFDDNGNVYQVLGEARDISDRKRVETTLRKTEERYSLATRAAKVGVWEWNLKTNELFIDPNIKALTGHTNAEVANDLEHWLALAHPDDRDFIMATTLACLDGKIPELVFEHRMVHKNGSVIWVWVRGELLRDAAGNPERLIGTDTDISALKQAELALQQLNAELEQRVQQRTQELARSEQDLRTIFNNVYDAILIHDLDGTILDANDRALELRGATREQLLAATIPEFAAPDAPLERLPEILERVGAGETMRFEWREKRFDDHSTFDVEVSLRRVTLANRLVFIAGVRDISDRKQAERALRASERRYASLATAAPVAIFRFDLALNCTYVNDQWSEMTGRPQESALGRGWLEAVHPNDRAPILAQATNNTRFSPDYINNGEGRHLLPDGSIRWFYARVAPEMDADGKVFGLIGTLTDITARKHMEFALAESEAKFRRLVEGTNVLVWAFDENGNFTYLSPQFQTLFGWEPEEWIGQPFIELVHPDDRLTLQTDYYGSLRVGERPRHPEFRHRHRDGHYIWVSSSATPILAPDGTMIGAQGIVADISARKQAENDLRESQQFIQTVLDTVPLPMFWKDRNSVFLGCNQQLANIMGLASSADIVGKTGFEFSPTTDEVANYNADDQEVITSGVAKLGIEETFTLPNGKQQWIETHKAPLRDWAGNVVGLVGMFQNITDRKQAEIALRESQRFLQTVIDTFPLVVFWKNRQSVYLGCNRHSAIAAGLDSPADIIGKTDYDLPWGATEGDAYRADDRRVMESGEAKLGIIETQVRADGRRIWIETNKLPLYNLDGEVIGVLGTYQDITARKQAEEDLRAQRLRLQLALDAAQMGTWSCILDTGRLIWSDRAQEIFGFEPGTFPGDRDTFLALVHADDRERVIQAITHTFEIGAPYDIEYRIHRLDGEIRWIAVWGIIQDLPDSDRQLIGVVCDITDRKQVEAAVQQSEQDLRTIFNHVYDAIFIYDLNGTILDVNERALELNRTTREQLLAASIVDLSSPDAPLDQLPAIFQRVQIGQAVCFEWSGQRLGDQSVFESEITLRMVTLASRSVYIAVIRDISDRKYAEQALRESEERLRLALTAANQGLYDLNLLTGEEIVTPEYATMLGYDPGTFYETESSWLARLHPDDVERVLTVYRAYLAGAIPQYKVEFRQQTQNGQWKWILSQGKVVAWDEAGNPLRILGIHTDIDDRKRAEEDLRQAVTTNQALLNAIPDLILLISRDGIYRDGIPTRELALFLAHDELVGKSLWDILPADLAQQRLDSIEQAFQTGMPQVQEYQILINGELRYEEARCVVCRDEEAMVLVRDITDRKQAELALSEAQQFAQSIAENTPNIIYIYDLISQCNLYTNQEVLPLLGYTAEEVKTMGAAFLPSVIHHQDWQTVYDLHKEIVHAPDQQIFELEYRVRHRQGNWRWLLDRITVFKRDEAGRVIQYIGSAQDITQRKQLEQELRQMNAELEIRVEERTTDLRQAMEAAEAANRAKSAFLANMSHELRTPLNAILGFTQLMSRDRMLDGEKRQQLSIINRSGNHLLNLINDILEMSKIEAGRIYFSPHSFDLYALLDTLEAMFQVRATEKRLRLIIHRDPSLPQYVETDENKVRQVLINLIGNAIKFTSSGQVVLQINCQPAKVPDPGATLSSGGKLDGLELRFAVTDTGVGIDPDELESLFEPFVQSTNRQGFQEGTGLGLPISRQFVQLMGGYLTVNSTPGVGSTFMFTIPVRVVDTANWTDKSLPRHILGLAPDQPTYRMLVVEDQETNRLLLIKLLQSIGFEVQAAVNGQEAIALWETWHPQLIWMDMRMPIMDGYEATRRIREAELSREWNRPPTVIIALTANAFEEDRAKILDVGCNDFVRKPYQEADLLERISSHLGVQYLYAATNETVSKPPTDSFDVIASLQALSADLRAQLYQATIQLDSQQLATLIEVVALEQPKLATLLTDKLNDFALEQILTLLQEVITTPE